MRVFLTKGLFGERAEQIGNGFKSFSKAFKAFAEWKAQAKASGSVQARPYDRIIHRKESGEIAVDFGDHSWFVLFADVN